MLIRLSARAQASLKRRHQGQNESNYASAAPRTSWDSRAGSGWCAEDGSYGSALPLIAEVQATCRLFFPFFFPFFFPSTKQSTYNKGLRADARLPGYGMGEMLIECLKPAAFPSPKNSWQQAVGKADAAVAVSTAISYRSCLVLAGHAGVCRQELTRAACCLERGNPQTPTLVCR